MLADSIHQWPNCFYQIIVLWYQQTIYVLIPISPKLTNKLIKQMWMCMLIVWYPLKFSIHNLHPWYWNSLWYCLISSGENSAYILQIMPFTILHFFPPASHHCWWTEAAWYERLAQHLYTWPAAWLEQYSGSSLFNFSDRTGTGYHTALWYHSDDWSTNKFTALKVNCDMMGNYKQYLWIHFCDNGKPIVMFLFDCQVRVTFLTKTLWHICHASVFHHIIQFHISGTLFASSFHALETM